MAAEKENQNDRGLTITRLLDAPIELVWEVWAKPEHISKWWGPTGFTDTIHEMDFRPGGYWRHIMHGPDGTDFPNESRFKEIVKHERIVYQHFKPDFTATVEFRAEGSKTHIKWNMLFGSKEEFEMVVRQFKADSGLKQNIDKLENYLANSKHQNHNAMTTANKELSITRIIDAPLATVWDAWTDKKQLALWWGPTGFTNPVCEWKAQNNGKIYIEMKAPNGTIFPMNGIFTEVVENEKLVFTAGALDANGERLFDILNTITFSEENGKTKINLHFIISNIKPEGEHYIAGQEMGWNLSLDRLTNQTDRHPFVIERTFNAPTATVWKAITDSDQMKQWYFDMNGFKPEVGTEFSFFGEKDGIKFVHLCQVKEVIANKKISYSWRYEGYEGDSLVTFELFEEGLTTRLKLTHAGLETFTVFAKHNFAAGWNHIINTSLEGFLFKTV